VKRLFLLCFLVIAIHNAEEAATMPAWMEAHMPDALARLGLPPLQPPTRERLYAGLVAVTVVPGVLLAAAALGRPRGAAAHAGLAVIGVFVWNALVPHLALTVALGAYFPGVLSAALLILPCGVVTYRRAVTGGYASRTGAALALLSAAVLYPAGMLLLWRPLATA
jgi:hypothetical protein